MSREIRGEGVDVTEAKARALAEIRRRAPALDEAEIAVQVVEEGERGLLGIGAKPARVIAFVELPDEPVREESELAQALRAYGELVAGALATGSQVELKEDGDTLDLTFSGGELGILIGRRGQTIAAIEQIANAITHQRQGSDAKRVSVDAAGYRDRQKAALSYAALRAAKLAISSGEPQALEPMSAFERRLVHERLKEYPGVTTTSDGAEPARYVVVLPADEN
jgi:spoIIIJ-associated protein